MFENLTTKLGGVFDALRKRLAALPAAARPRLDAVLEETGCLRHLI